MLTPSRRRRSLDAHFHWLNVARKSAMMAEVGSDRSSVLVPDEDAAAIVRVT